MRNREVIEREMFRAREDLEANLAELRHTVQEKVDLKARAQVAIAKGKLKARDAFERGKQASHELADRGTDAAADLYVKARQRPALFGAIAGAFVAFGAIVYVGRKRDWW